LTPRRQIELFLTYLQRRQIRVDDLVTHRFTPDDAPRVYPMLAGRSASSRDRGATIGVVFDWSGHAEG